MAATDVARTNGSNGNGNGSQPEPAPRIVFVQQSFSGTERGRDGIQLPDDYVRELQDPVRRMEIFEEMGNDDAIATALQDRTKALSAGNWLLSSDDDSTLGREILEFCEDNIYPHLENLIRWLGGNPLQYGFSAIEPVFAWSDTPPVQSVTRGQVTRPTRANGDRRIYLVKLAHIRPAAVTAFKLFTNGDLEYLSQNIYDGSTFIDRNIPAGKLLIRVYDRQGDDHYGVPPMRKVYKAWKIKTQIEKLNLLHFDRFGVGVPVLTEPEGGFQASERTLAMQALQLLRAGATNAFTFPAGSKLEILTAAGNLAGAMVEWTRLYNLQIAKVFATQQTELGSTETGSRAVGETFDEQRTSVIQADAEDVANLINNILLIPIVRYNFGEQQVYPSFAPSGKVKAKATLAAELKTLKDAGAIKEYRPEDEAHLRDLYELPSVSIEDLQAAQDERDAQAAAIADAQTTPTEPASPPPAGDGSQSDAPRTSDRPPQPALRVAASAIRALAVEMAEGAPEPNVPGETTRRTLEYQEWESRVLRPEILTADLDRQATRLSDEVREALRAIDEDLAGQAMRAAEKGPTAAQQIVKTIAVPDRLRRQLRSVMLDAARRARDYGESTVRNEVERQIGSAGIGPQRSPRIPSLVPSSGIGAYSARLGRAVLRMLRSSDGETNPRDAHLEAEIDRAVNEEIRRREAATEYAIVTAISQAAAKGALTFVSVVATAIKDALLALSPNRTEANVQGVVNVGFGIGRADQADAILEQADRAERGGSGGSRSGLRDAEGNPIGLRAKVYSAVMDLGTCDVCAKWDGGEFPIDFPEDFTGVQCPNPQCEGGYARCRCVWIYITDEESVPNVGPSKGPVPLAQVKSEETITALRADFEAKLATLKQELGKADATPQPISIALTIEAPKPGTTKKTIALPDGREAVITETSGDS